jgi:hypothetical protein
MAALKLEAENAVIAQMNKLKFRQRYEALCSFKMKRQNIFKSIPYLESNGSRSKNADVANTLLNVYSALEMTAQKKTLEAK